jgi:hypothetical protein
VDGIEGDDTAGQVEFAEQPLCGGDFGGLLVTLHRCQHQAGIHSEGMQHLGRLAVGDIVEASPQRLAIKREAAVRRLAGSFPQAGGVTAEHLLDRSRVEALKDVADGGMGRGPLPMQAEGGVQPAAMHPYEGLDGAEGIAAGDHGKDGKQQDIGQFV